MIMIMKSMRSGGWKVRMINVDSQAGCANDK
jgi:hypothetical protein